MKFSALLVFMFFVAPFVYAGAVTNSAADSTADSYQPGDHELLFMPTAYTMPAGNAYFSDYELALINYTIAPTSSTHIGLFSLFPITTSFMETLTIGGKQNYYRSENFSGALFASYTFKPGFYTLGNVFSFGHKSRSLHLGVTLTGDGNGGTEWLFLLGGRYDFSKKVSGIVEYTNGKSLMEDAKFNGLLTFGFRFRTESISWELAGIRPLAETGDLLLIPLLKATICF
ncbi:MAG: hypothetical protein ACM3P0_09225 [Acidobacteriota bacterium]